MYFPLETWACMIEFLQSVAPLTQLRLLPVLKELADSRLRALPKWWWFSHQRTTKRRLRTWVVQDRLDMLDWWRQLAFIPTCEEVSYLAKLAAGQGHLRILKWLHQCHLLTTLEVNDVAKGQVVRAAFVNGDAKVLDWLYDTFGPLDLHPVYQYSLPLMARRGHVLSNPSLCLKSVYYLKRYGRSFTTRERNRIRRLGWDFDL